MEIVDKRVKDGAIENAGAGDVLATGNRYWYMAYDPLAGKMLIINLRTGIVIDAEKVSSKDHPHMVNIKKNELLDMRVAKHVKMVIS